MEGHHSYLANSSPGTLRDKKQCREALLYGGSETILPRRNTLLKKSGRTHPFNN
jgi:hypothetical protein